MIELKPFMRPVGEAVPDREEQVLAYQALCRYFRLKFDQHSGLVAPDPNGDTLPISTGPELTVLLQAHRNPDGNDRTTNTIDVPQDAHFRYRAQPGKKLVRRIVYPLDYAVALDYAAIYPDEHVDFLTQAQTRMEREQAQGVNFIPVGVEEIAGLSAFLDQGEVLPHGGMNWEPTL